MLNLAQTREIIKSGPRPVANVANPTGEASVMSDLYRALKTAGWQSTGQVHPTDRVSTLTFNGATIRRNCNAAPGAWIVEVLGGEFYTDAPIAELTARVIELTTEAEIKPASPASEIADGLRAIYPELSGRIDKALAMVEAGQASKYQTEWDNAGKDGNWRCDCPDATHRNMRAHFGVACYHAIAGHIRQELDKRAAVIRSREVEKRQQRAIARGDYARPSDFTPKADPLNVHGYRQNFNRQVQYGR